MKKVTEEIYFIKGQDEMIPDSHVFVIGQPNSGDLSLIDAGLVGKGKYKIQTLKDAGYRLSDVKRIILTHTHFDHIGCLSEILKSIPHAEIWVHESEGTALEEGDEKTVYGMSMFENMCQAQYGLKPGAFRFKVHRKLEGGDLLEIGGMKWEVLHIPGHSRGSIALYNRSGRILIPGDTVYSDYAIGRFDLHGASGSELKESLLTLADLQVDILLPGHNRIVENLPPGYILQTANQWAPYLA